MSQSEAAEPRDPPHAKRPPVSRVVAGKYVLHELLAEGRQSAVYRASGPAPDSRLALKLMFRADGVTKERILALRGRLTELRHPGIVRVFDLGETAEQELFVAMELLQGETLAERLLLEERLSPAHVVSLGSAVCAALEAAHARGLLHGDVKPSNIFLARRPDGSVVPTLLDLGLARSVAVEPAVIRRATIAHRHSQYLQLSPRDIAGSPRYLSPEQLRGEALDGGADIYALATTLYEALAGSPPFPTNDLGGLLAKILWEMPEPLKQRAPEAEVPEALDRALQRALSKLPDQRFADPAELGRALEDAMKPSAPLPPEDNLPLPLLRPRLRAPVAVWLGVVTLVLAVLLWWRAPEPKPAAGGAQWTPPATAAVEWPPPAPAVVPIDSVVPTGLAGERPPPELPAAPKPRGGARSLPAPAPSATTAAPTQAAPSEAPPKPSAEPPTSYRVDDLKSPF